MVGRSGLSSTVLGRITHALDTFDEKHIEALERIRERGDTAIETEEETTEILESILGIVRKKHKIAGRLKPHLEELEQILRDLRNTSPKERQEQVGEFLVTLKGILTELRNALNEDLELVKEEVVWPTPLKTHDPWHDII